jgi:hypothetical protein
VEWMNMRSAFLQEIHDRLEFSPPGDRNATHPHASPSQGHPNGTKLGHWNGGTRRCLVDRDLGG